ncbi:general substrate transporter [Aspergillus steynii IBT 23096]|uniref:General substrate transporter n=1 Tax=Aspergillus steynii IBT 23096 TaxID=1392250 RepID=A0A2I2FV42_9EURO|nr:general substrate transporter [Aspergillus steynii IBT 23096]PLB44510.1 general substrate transporter [Aspergillus steynii IBT 23096]
MKDQDIVGAALASVLPQYNKIWIRIPHLLQLNLILLIPLLSSAVAGYDGSLMNGLQSISQWQNYFGNPTGSTLGVVNAAQSIGSVLALPVTGTLSDRIGRRLTLLSGSIIIVIASAIQAASVQYGMFVFSRVLVGVGSMFVVHPSPMLISELAYPTHRGKYTCAFWTMYYLGAILASWTSYGTQKHLQSDWSWRVPSIIQAGFPIVQIAFWWCVPESPRWLIAQGRKDEAERLLARFHTAGDSSHPLIRFEMEEIVQTIELESQAAEMHWSALVKSPGNRKRTFIAACIGTFAQWNGVAVVSYYLTLVLNTVGIRDSDTQTLINGLLQVFNFIAALGAALFVDYLGRRTLFLWSAVGMLLSFIIWTICSALFDQTQNPALGHTVIGFVFIFYFHYDIAYTPLLLGYPTEIFPYSTRSKGIAVDLMCVYGSLIVLAFVNPIALERIGWHYYIFFCCFDAVVVAITWFFFPETKGHSLEEIAAVFDGPSARSGGVFDKGDGVVATAEHSENAD